MIHCSKRPLDLSEYAKYDISKEFNAFEYKFDHIIEERSYDIESDILEEGLIIHHDELIQVSINVYNYIVIVSKSS